MADIKYDFTEYEWLVASLNFKTEAVNLQNCTGVSIGSSCSETAREYEASFRQLVNVMRKYKWLLQHTVSALETAAEELEQTDLNLGDFIGDYQGSDYSHSEEYLNIMAECRQELEDIKLEYSEEIEGFHSEFLNQD